jgi:hypothetical protein
MFYIRQFFLFDKQNEENYHEKHNVNTERAEGLVDKEAR